MFAFLIGHIFEHPELFVLQSQRIDLSDTVRRQRARDMKESPSSLVIRSKAFTIGLWTLKALENQGWQVVERQEGQSYFRQCKGSGTIRCVYEQGTQVPQLNVVTAGRKARRALDAACSEATQRFTNACSTLETHARNHKAFALASVFHRMTVEAAESDSMLTIDLGDVIAALEAELQPCIAFTGDISESIAEALRSLASEE